MSGRENTFQILKKLLPDNTANIDFVVDLIHSYPVVFKVVRPRKTKLGDFRAGIGEKMSQITVNGNLNPYNFLITTIHEIAHYFTFLEYGGKVKPHGREWQNIFQKLLNDIPDFESLPQDIQLALNNYMQRPKASSCTDVKLMRVLSRYDKNDDTVFLEQLPIGTSFELDKRRFKILSKARTRYLCQLSSENKKYKVHALARVKPV